jgi:hypothetical protein
LMLLSPTLPQTSSQRSVLQDSEQLNSGLVPIEINGSLRDGSIGLIISHPSYGPSKHYGESTEYKHDWHEKSAI